MVCPLPTTKRLCGQSYQSSCAMVLRGRATRRYQPSSAIHTCLETPRLDARSAIGRGRSMLNQASVGCDHASMRGHIPHRHHDTLTLRGVSVTATQRPTSARRGLAVVARLRGSDWSLPFLWSGRLWASFWHATGERAGGSRGVQRGLECQTIGSAASARRKECHRTWA